MNADAMLMQVFADAMLMQAFVKLYKVFIHLLIAIVNTRRNAAQERRTTQVWDKGTGRTAYAPAPLIF